MNILYPINKRKETLLMNIYQNKTTKNIKEMSRYFSWDYKKAKKMYNWIKVDSKIIDLLLMKMRSKYNL
jgi:hypothetical protein